MEISENTISYVSSFRPHYKTFFEELLRQQANENWVVQYAHLLKTPNLAEKEIPSLITQLQQFAVTPENATHVTVRAGREILRRFFEQKHSVLYKYGVIPIVYGSLLYDDPHNLDYDVVLLGQQYNPDMKKLSVFDWLNELNEQWLNDREGHLSYVTLEKIEKYAKLFGDDTHIRQIKLNTFDIQQLMSDVSIIFSGSPVLKNDTSLLPALRGRCTTLMSQEPLLPAIVTFDLRDTLRVRHERRGI